MVTHWIDLEEQSFSHLKEVGVCLSGHCDQVDGRT